jgi:hypothetical protein
MGGDIIRVDGINMKPYHDPEGTGTRLKVLAQHLSKAPDGKPTTIAVVTDWVKTQAPYEGKMVKALALYCEWLKDDNGNLLPLSKEYYDQVNAKPFAGIDTGSVGLTAFDYKLFEPTGGREVISSNIFEFSLCSVPQNASATLIKEIDSDQKDISAIKALLESIKNKPYLLKEDIDKSLESLNKTLNGITERFDTLESIVVMLSKAMYQVKDNQKNDTNEKIKQISKTLDRLNDFLE